MSASRTPSRVPPRAAPSMVGRRLAALHDLCGDPSGHPRRVAAHESAFAEMTELGPEVSRTVCGPRARITDGTVQLARHAHAEVSTLLSPHMNAQSCLPFQQPSLTGRARTATRHRPTHAQTRCAAARSPSPCRPAPPSTSWSARARGRGARSAWRLEWCGSRALCASASQAHTRPGCFCGRAASASTAARRAQRR